MIVFGLRCLGWINQIRERFKKIKRDRLNHAGTSNIRDKR
jgi:hypothetical protein